MKKILSILLTAFMLLSLVACDLGSLPQGNEDTEQTDGGGENKPPSGSGEGEGNNNGSGENNEDDPPAKTNTALDEFEQTVAAFLNLESFDLGEGVSLQYAAGYTGTTATAYLECENASELVSKIRQMIPSDYTFTETTFGFSAEKLVTKVYFDEWWNAGINGKYYYNTVRASDLGSTVSFSVSSETGLGSDEAVNAYVNKGVPLSEALCLAELDSFASGKYETSKNYIYVCENGDVVRILNGHDQSRIRVMTPDLKYYDLHVGHVGDQDLTDYCLHDFKDSEAEFYVVKAETVGELYDLYGADLVGERSYATHIDAIEEILGLSGVELLDWGELDYAYTDRVEIYEQERYYYYGTGWLDGYYAAPIHECRDEDYLPESVKDMVEYTQVSRDNTIYDKEHRVLYSVNTRKIVFDDGAMTEDLINQVITHWQSLGIAGEMNSKNTEWKGSIYVYTEYVDGEAFTKWDEYEIEWYFEDDDPAENYVTITITYWYHSIYV